MVEVIVHGNNIDEASRKLKRELQKEGVFKAIKRKRHYEKPSIENKRKTNESLRRRRKLERKRNAES